MTNATKILLISNCQVQPLKHGLSTVCKNLDIEALGVHLIAPADRDKVFAGYIAKKEEYDFVLSVSLSGEFGALTREQIETSFHPTPVIGITNIVYKGEHPDITYIGSLSQRAAGPIGDYHSQIALLAYLMELPVATALKMYCDQVYSKMGYYEEFASSLEELRRRDVPTTIPIGDILDRRLLEGLCFLSHNHPTSFLLAPYINKIAGALAEMGYVERSGQDILPEELVNFLAFSSTFPVFPEIAQYHKMAFPGSYVFRTPTIGDVPSRPLSLQEFVEDEYKAFLHVERSILVDSYPGNILMSRFGSDAAFREMVMSLV